MTSASTATWVIPDKTYCREVYDAFESVENDTSVDFPRFDNNFPSLCFWERFDISYRMDYGDSHNIIPTVRNPRDGGWQKNSKPATRYAGHAAQYIGRSLLEIKNILSHELDCSCVFHEFALDVPRLIKGVKRLRKFMQGPEEYQDYQKLTWALNYFDALLPKLEAIEWEDSHVTS
jgi:hypothetical protein